MKAPVRFLLLPLALAVTLLAGCGKKQSGDVPHYGSAKSRDARSAADPHAGHNHGSGHVHRAPNGGELVELGDHQFNLEFKYDAGRGVLQVWVLDAHAENFIRIGMDAFEVVEDGGQRRVVTLQATANAMTGETVGATSYFEGAAPWLGAIKHFDGVVRAVRVRGVDFRDVRFHFHPTGT
jgi:hypothetical protein